MEGQLGLSELSVISWVSAFQGCPLRGVPLYVEQNGSTNPCPFVTYSVALINQYNLVRQSLLVGRVWENLSVTMAVWDWLYLDYKKCKTRI